MDAHRPSSDPLRVSVWPLGCLHHAPFSPTARGTLLSPSQDVSWPKTCFGSGGTLSNPRNAVPLYDVGPCLRPRLSCRTPYRGCPIPRRLGEATGRIWLPRSSRWWYRLPTYRTVLGGSKLGAAGCGQWTLDSSSLLARRLLPCSWSAARHWERMRSDENA